MLVPMMQNIQCWIEAVIKIVFAAKYILLLMTGCDFVYTYQSMHPPGHARADTMTFKLPDSLLHSENIQIDSMLHLAAVAPPDTGLARLYYDIGNLYENNDHEKGKYFYLKSEILSKYLHWNEGHWLYGSAFSIMLAREGLTDSALVILSQGLELAKKENNEGWTANFLINTGTVYFVKEWNQTALSYFMEALPYLEHQQDPEALGKLYAKMVQVYRSINNLEKAVEYGELSIALLKENQSLVYALYELALTYSRLQQHEKAREDLLMALDIVIEQNNTYLMEFIYYQLGFNALYVFDLKNVELYLKKMVEISGEEKMLNDLRYLMLLGKLEELKGHFALSEKYVMQALKIATERDAIETKRLFYQILSELSIAQSKYRDNMRYWDEMDRIDVAIANDITIHAAVEMSAKYETTKKELEIEQQQEIIQRHAMQRFLFVAGIVICVVFLILLWYMLWLRNRHNRDLSEHNELLAELNATKDKFFSIISHDLKNPAIALCDALQLLVNNAHLWNADMRANFYNELLSSSNDLVTLLYSLLNWAQLQTGRMIFQPNLFPLSNLNPTISLIRGLAEKKGITFIVNMQDDDAITCDGNMFIVIVRNLLSNAVKFTDEGGTVVLEILHVSQESVGLQESGDSQDSAGAHAGAPLHAISVSDTGIGMNAAQINHLFCLDNLISRSGTAGESGSGLGLIVCKELLDKHGARLHVESEEGKGSRFWFTV
jgi:signal transduction histidine kinase